MRIPCRRSPSSRTAVIALAVLGAGLLAGCSGSSTGAPAGAIATVASVPQVAGPSSSGSAAPTADETTIDNERPLIREDTSPAEVDRLEKAYGTCLMDHGVRIPSAYGVGQDPTYVIKFSSLPKYKAQRTACLSKEPESLQDRMKRQQPQVYADKVRTEVNCMRAHGLSIEVEADGTWGYNNPARDMGSTWDVKCEHLAFGD